MNVGKAGLTVATFALALSACGGSARPSQDEISKAITSKDSLISTIPKDKADCFAKILEESKLSDKTLQALVEGDQDYKGTKKEASILTSLGSKAVKECA